jgi:hypothetical protein
MSDPYFGNVVLLLPFSGTAGSATFTDYSLIPKLVTRTGDVVISSGATLFDENTAYFDGSGDYLSLADSPDWDFSGDFTVEFFCYLAAASGAFYTKGILGTGQIGGADGFFIGHYQNTLTIRVNATAYGSAGSFGAGAWHFLKLVQSGSGLSVQLDGVEVYSGAAVTLNAAVPLIIGNGSPDDVNRGFFGYLAQLRITKGVARTDATVPSAPFPTTSGTYLLAGNATKASGGAADQVVIRNWTTRGLVSIVTPDSAGDWTISLPPGDYDITYFATDCQPICHGPYTVTAS